MASTVVDLYHSLRKSMDPALCCQTFFLLAAGGVLAIAALPPAPRRQLLDYGAREAQPQARARTEVEKLSAEKRKPQKDGWFDKLIVAATSWGQIPHAWFATFYVAYIASALFWLIQFLWDGEAMRWITARQAQNAGSASMTFAQVLITAVLMALQAVRRLYEHVAVMKPSKSKMWFVHWLLGLAFYTCLSISVWVEGSQAIVEYKSGLTVNDSRNSRSVLAKVAVGVPLFVLGWTRQYQCHRYLASLQKYSLPESGMFRYTVCAHYTCECIIYLSLAIVAAPEGRVCNRTLLCALIFVATNLGVTADGTKRWYLAKFGAERVAARWRMIPFIF